MNLFFGSKLPNNSAKNKKINTKLTYCFLINFKLMNHEIGFKYCYYYLF